MTRRLVLPLVVVLVALVLGGMFLFTRNDDASAPQAGAAAAKSAVPAPAVSAPKAPDAPLSADPGAPAAAGRTAIATEAKSVVAGASAAPKAAPVGIELTGVVVNAAGAPVVGAKVFAGGEGGFDFGMPLDALGDGPRGSSRMHALTDAEGRFRLAGVGAGRQRVAVRAPKFAPYDAPNVVIPAGATHDMGVIALEPGGVLRGHVVDRRGAPIASAHVRRVLEPQSGELFFVGGGLAPSAELAQSGADGSFLVDTLPVGPFKLRIWHDEHPDQTASGSVELAGQVVAPLSIVLDDGYSIAGRVTGAPASAASDLLVRAAPLRQGGGDFDFDFDGGQENQGGDARTANVGANGAFEVRGLRADKDYNLTLKRSAGPEMFDFGRRLSVRVQARAGERGVEIAFRPESSLVFQVIDARTREPVERLEVLAGIGFPMPVAPQPGEQRGRYKDGRVVAGNLRPRQPDDRATLTIKAVGYRDWSREDIALVEGEAADLGVIELHPTPVVTVTVLDDASNAPVRDARVSLRKVRETPRGGAFEMRRSIAVRAGGSGEDEPEEDIDFDGADARSGRTDEDGEARVSSFEGERCELVVTHPKFAPLTTAPFVCSASGDVKTVHLRLGGSALVKLLDAAGQPLAGGRVERRSSAQAAAGEMVFGAGANSSAVTDADGVARFDRLEAGVHEFRPAKKDSGMIGGGGSFVMIAGMDNDEGDWVSAEVREGETAQLTLQAPLELALSGVVTEGGQPLAAATVSLARKPSGSGTRMPPMPFGGGPQARTDSRGEYELSGVLPGDYILTVSHSARAMPTEIELRVGERDLRQDVALSLAIVEGRIVGADGKPMAGARVAAERHREGAQARPMMRMVIASDSGGMSVLSGGVAAPEVFSDEDGRYALRGVAADVKIVVTAEAKGMQPARSAPLEVGVNEIKRGVDLTLAEAGALDVSVFKADGSPAQMVVVTATAEGDAARGVERKSGFIQEDGKTTLDGLAPGAWRVAVRPVGVGAAPSGSGSGSGAALEQIVQVKSRESTAVRFDLP